MDEIKKQLVLAFIESDFMLGTLYNSQKSPVLINGKRTNRDVFESFNLKYLIYYSYHYIYDLKSVFEILKHSKSIELKNYKEAINAFTNSPEAKIIDVIKNDRIHHKKKNLITVSYNKDKFNKKYVFCELPFYILGTDGLRGARKDWDLNHISNASYSELVNTINYIRINLNLPNSKYSGKKDFSIIEFIVFLYKLRKNIIDFLAGIGIEIPDYDKSDYIKIN